MTLVQAVRLLSWRPNTLQMKYLADLLDFMTEKRSGKPATAEYLRLWQRIEDLYRIATGKPFLP